MITVLSGIVSGQKPDQEKPCIYVDAEGKLFVNKQLPVYLWISTSPKENAPAYRLTSDSSKRYSNPMYFDTEGRNTIRSPWAVDTVSRQVVNPQMDIVFDVYADGNPPVTRAKMTGKSTFTRNGLSCYSGKVEIALSSTDAVSGVSASYYSLNGKSFEKYAHPVTLEDDGNYTLAWYSVDQVGNREKEQERKFALDNSAPVTTFTIDGMMIKNYVSSRASIVLKSTDDMSGVKTIYYRINQGQEVPYTVPVPASRLADGKSSISFYAVDNLSNREEVQIIGAAVSAGTDSETSGKRVFEFYVDNTPPAVNLTLEGDQYKAVNLYVSPRTRIVITGEDDKSGLDQIRYGIDAASRTTIFNGPFTLETPGLHFIQYEAADFVGNTSVPASYRVYADARPPLSTIMVNGMKYTKRDTLYIGKDASFSLQASDDESGLGTLSCAVDEEDYRAYASSLTIDSEGFHRIRYYASDKVNNQEDARNMDFFVDLTPPEIHYHFSVPAIGTKTVRDEEYTIYPTNTQIYLAATDKKAGGESVQYTVNGGQVMKEIPVKDLLPGNYIIKIIANDVLKNKSEQELKFAIEK